MSEEPRTAPETAGHLALKRVPIVAASGTVGSVRQMIRSAAFDSVDLILLTDASGRHVSSVALRRLVESDDATLLTSIANPDWPSVPAGMDQEQATGIAIRENVTVLPVLSADGYPVGVLTAHTLIDVLGREHREDIHLAAGIMREREGARHALEDPPLKRVASRLPWLMVGLALSSLATGVMSNYEAALQSNVMIAFFIPAVVYLADAVGTQTEAIAVRGLSTRDQPLLTLLGSEIMVGGVIGAILGLLAFTGVWIAFGNIGVATGVGVSLFAAGALASSIGLMFPWALGRIGVDPAFGAGPVATIAQDVLTILIYFVVMTKLVAVA